MTKITRALISVSDKEGLREFAQFLYEQGIEILSTGGTAKLLRDAGIGVKEVSEHTGFPEIMDGRVKTLHPKIHGGLLARRDDKAHLQAMQDHAITPIDLVIINLYPFEQTVARGGSYADCIENIDIGGPSMVRSAAKNHADVTIIVDPSDYLSVREEIKQSGNTTLATRKKLAAKAYARTAAYDAAISRWFAGQLGIDFPPTLSIAGQLQQPLHYGENPHQKAAFYATAYNGPSLATARLMLGEKLSYNNLNDASAAYELASEFSDTAVAIIKHANPCGVALGATLAEAYTHALACDPVSAYGGIIAVNRKLDKAFCVALGKLFAEVIIAPDADDEAIAMLSEKKKLRLLLTGGMSQKDPNRMVVKSISGGFLYQQDDMPVLPEGPLKTVTKAAPTAQQESDLRFAFTVAKHVKSNTIVLVKDNATIGIGAGQMSRIDSTRIACSKAQAAGLSTKGCVLASDAFFPFPDNVELAAEAGVCAIIQPGGSIRDGEVIEAADKAGIAMQFAGMRHFRH